MLRFTARIWICILFGIAFSALNVARGQNTGEESVKADTIKTRNSILVYPLVFYLPETRFGGGMAAIYTFRFKGESPKTNPSQIRFNVERS